MGNGHQSCAHIRGTHVPFEHAHICGTTAPSVSTSSEGLSTRLPPAGYNEAAGTRTHNEGDRFPYRARQSSNLRLCRPDRPLATYSGECAGAVATAGPLQPEFPFDAKRRSLSANTSSLGDLHPVQWKQRGEEGCRKEVAVSFPCGLTCGWGPLRITSVPASLRAGFAGRTSDPTGL